MILSKHRSRVNDVFSMKTRLEKEKVIYKEGINPTALHSEFSSLTPAFFFDASQISHLTEWSLGWEMGTHIHLFETLSAHAGLASDWYLDTFMVLPLNSCMIT